MRWKYLGTLLGGPLIRRELDRSFQKGGKESAWKLVIWRDDIPGIGNLDMEE